MLRSVGWVGVSALLACGCQSRKEVVAGSKKDYEARLPALRGSDRQIYVTDGDESLSMSVRQLFARERGFPTEIHIDYDKNAIGDELDVVLTTVTALAR